MDSAYLSIMTAAGPQKVVMGDRPITVGRHPENLLVLGDVQSSRFHCVIARTPDGTFLIRDLDSRNGTRVNGKPIKTSLLKKGDIIAIGTTEIRLVVPGSGFTVVDDPNAPPAESAEPAALEPATTEIVEDAPAADDDFVDLGAVQAAAEEEQRLSDFVADVTPEAEDVHVDFTAASQTQDDEKFLPVLAESLPDQGFPAEEIALVNARGQVVHPPVSSAPRRKTFNPASGEAVGVLRYVLLICARGRATDVHVEPRTDDFLLRLRIDGNMIDVVRLSKAMGTRFLALVKIMCDIDVQFRNIIQEGHFTALVPGRKIDYRISFAPAMFGQKLVMRVLDTANAPLHTPDLRLPTWMQADIQRAMQADQGMILVCGPTGSGKTTTLYAVLRDVGVAHRNVVTIEDPVEIEIEGVTQVPVNEDKGSTFSTLLRSMLRQDPDVMMVGEIRDGETARIAMQAAITGHLVLSTVHAKDTISTVFRLLDLGAEPYLVSSSLQLIIAQRLARKLCPYCKKAVKPKPDQLKRMGKLAQGVAELFVPVGCPSCLKTGYAGRRAFFEMLTATDELREVILKNPTPREIENSLAGTQFMKLMHTGYQLVAEGVTAFDEVEKVVGR